MAIINPKYVQPVKCKACGNKTFSSVSYRTLYLHDAIHAEKSIEHPWFDLRHGPFCEKCDEFWNKGKLRYLFTGDYIKD